MASIDIGLFWFIAGCAVLAAWIEWRQRTGWAPVLLLIAIGLAFLAHFLLAAY